jgi:hypothetical protein
VTAAYALALAITLATEVPIVAVLYRGQRLRLAACCAAATTATHLLMHFALPHVVAAPAVVPLGEALALVLEALAYWLAARPRALGLALVASALANLASYAAGLLLFG